MEKIFCNDVKSSFMPFLRVFSIDPTPVIEDHPLIAALKCPLCHKSSICMYGSVYKISFASVILPIFVPILFYMNHVTL